MSSNRVKKRYQSKGNTYPVIALTGRSYLLHHHEGYEELLEKGDVLFYLYSDTARRERDDPGYESTGGSGYLKADLYDGRNWQPLVMDDLFTDKEHHFSKKERPLDTYFRCAETITALQGTIMQRGYRSHYEPAPESPEA